MAIVPEMPQPQESHNAVNQDDIPLLERNYEYDFYSSTKKSRRSTSPSPTRTTSRPSDNDWPISPPSRRSPSAPRTTPDLVANGRSLDTVDALSGLQLRHVPVILRAGSDRSSTSSTFVPSLTADGTDTSSDETSPSTDDERPLERDLALWRGDDTLHGSAEADDEDGEADYGRYLSYYHRNFASPDLQSLSRSTTPVKTYGGSSYFGEDHLTRTPSPVISYHQRKPSRPSPIYHPRKADYHDCDSQSPSRSITSFFPAEASPTPVASTSFYREKDVRTSDSGAIRSAPQPKRPTVQTSPLRRSERIIPTAPSPSQTFQPLQPLAYGSSSFHRPFADVLAHEPRSFMEWDEHSTSGPQEAFSSRLGLPLKKTLKGQRRRELRGCMEKAVMRVLCCDGEARRN